MIMTIGEKIRAARKNAGMTQEELAAAIGVKAVLTVQLYENGSRKVSIETLERIAQALNVPLVNLLPRAGVDNVSLHMKLNEYHALATRTINPKLQPEQQLYHALHGMASEVGEIHGLFQKDFQGHDIDPLHLKKELGDLLWMIAECCTAMDWTLEDVAQANIDKLRERYPEGFDESKSLHRKEGDV